MTSALALQHLEARVGAEASLAEHYAAVVAELRGLGATAFGSLTVGCADEADHERSEAHRLLCAGPLLPPRRDGGQGVAFGLENMGARYEPGAAALAIDHFATPAASEGFLAIVVEILGHCAVEQRDGVQVYGSMTRYGRHSTCCGAIAALQAGDQAPALDDLRNGFTEAKEDLDRVLDASADTDPATRPLRLALSSAAVQGWRAFLELQQLSASVPFVAILLDGVVLNRPDNDAVLLGGATLIDRRGAEAKASGRPLVGGDPCSFAVAATDGSISLLATTAAT